MKVSIKLRQDLAFSIIITLQLITALPVLFAIAYYEPPMLTRLILNGNGFFETQVLPFLVVIGTLILTLLLCFSGPIWDNLNLKIERLLGCPISST